MNSREHWPATLRTLSSSPDSNPDSNPNQFNVNLASSFVKTNY